MKSTGLSNAEFAEKIGISPSSLSSIFSGRYNPSLDVVLGIHKAYPHININWLLYGEGEMSASAPLNNKQNSGYPHDTVNAVSQNLPAGDARNAENPENTHNGQFYFDFRKENQSEGPVFAPKQTVKEEVRYIEKPHPKISEIRIFYDNGTFEVFKPENK